MTDFPTLRKANEDRQRVWPGAETVDSLFRMVEIFGEAGELAEALKKHTRGMRGIKGSTADLTDIADEMADVIIAVDLLAMDLGIDLSAAVPIKFNKTSRKYDLPVTI